MALISAVHDYDGNGAGGKINWSGVAVQMGQKRSSQQYNVRWNATLKPRLVGDLKIGPWTTEEVRRMTCVRILMR